MTDRSGLVVAAHGRRGVLEVDGQRHPFIPKGRGLRVVCGDRVRFEARTGSEALLVTAIETRSNALARIHGRTRHEEIIAANLTQLIAVCAPRPAPDPFLLDRYACAAEILGCRFALVWNKYDLDGQAARSAADLASLGYPLLTVSALTGHGLVELSDRLAGETSVLAGQSGVGKSSLVNRLFTGSEAAVGELSAATATGTHTTTAVVMYAGGQGIRLLDTPGVRQFVPSVRSGQRLDRGFREMRETAARCRFSNCRHLQEPDCAVRAAVASGSISARRYASYCQLLATLDNGEPQAARR